MTLRDDGLAAFRQMLPGVRAEGVDSLRDGRFAEELGELAVDHVFATVWNRPGLDRRSRSLVTLGILIALRATDELKFHLRIAEHNGLSREELAEVVYQAAFYAGFPAAVAARATGIDVFDPPAQP